MIKDFILLVFLSSAYIVLGAVLPTFYAPLVSVARTSSCSAGQALFQTSSQTSQCLTYSNCTTLPPEKRTAQLCQCPIGGAISPPSGNTCKCPIGQNIFYIPSKIGTQLINLTIFLVPTVCPSNLQRDIFNNCTKCPTGMHLFNSTSNPTCAVSLVCNGGSITDSNTCVCIHPSFSIFLVDNVVKGKCVPLPCAIYPTAIGTLSCCRSDQIIVAGVCQCIIMGMMESNFLVEVDHLLTLLVILPISFSTTIIWVNYIWE